MRPVMRPVDVEKDDAGLAHDMIPPMQNEGRGLLVGRGLAPRAGVVQLGLCQKGLGGLAVRIHQNASL